MAARVWRVEFDAAAVRDMRKQGFDAERRVLRYLRNVLSAVGIRDGSVKRSPATAKAYGYRVGDYRIVAAIEDDRFVVLVVTVGHRREV